MILFYSEFCQHCKILLETIKRHDKNNMIKMVSIDVLRSAKKPIDPKIHSVPALLIIDTKEYLFGKAVFDYLLLPNRGVLFSTQLSKDDKKNEKISPPTGEAGEPSAFSLGSILSDNYASLDDSDQMRSDTNYKWDLIDDTQAPHAQHASQAPLTSLTPNAKLPPLAPLPTQTTDDKYSENKKLPSMEDIMKQRANDVRL